jgi:type VI protein secretion system component VasK
MTDLNTTIDAASQAVTGPGTPEAVSAKQALAGPMMWALIGSGPALCAMVCAAVWVLAWGPGWPAATASDRIRAIAIVCFGLVACLGLVVWRLAGSRRMEVKAGPASLSVDGG